MVYCEWIGIDEPSNERSRHFNKVFPVSTNESNCRSSRKESFRFIVTGRSEGGGDGKWPDHSWVITAMGAKVKGERRAGCPDLEP